jgi:L-ribulose-5-phosphate 3-epimerase
VAGADYIVNTYSFTLNYSVERCLEELAEEGFTAFELMAYPGHLWPGELGKADRERLRARFTQNSLRLCSLNQPNVDINLAAATAEMRDYSLSVVCGLVELAGDLGVEAVQIGPGKVNPLLPTPRAEVTTRFYRALDVLIPAADRAGTRILVENMPFAFLPGCEELVAAIEAYDSDKVGLTYDIANGAFIGEPLLPALQRCHHLLQMVHVSDTGRAVYRHDPIGCGEIDFAAARADLAAIGWSGRPVLEIIGDPEDPIAAVVDGARQLDALGWAAFASAAQV